MKRAYKVRLTPLFILFTNYPTNLRVTEVICTLAFRASGRLSLPTTTLPLAIRVTEVISAHQHHLPRSNREVEGLSTNNATRIARGFAPTSTNQHTHHTLPRSKRETEDHFWPHHLLFDPPPPPSLETRDGRSFLATPPRCLTHHRDGGSLLATTTCRFTHHILPCSKRTPPPADLHPPPSTTTRLNPPHPPSLKTRDRGASQHIHHPPSLET